MMYRNGDICEAGLATPIGVMEIAGTDEGILSVRFTERQEVRRVRNTSCGPVHDCILQLEEYFAGCRTEFTVPILLSGTPFQEQVWREILQIPYGASASYADVAAAIGRPSSFRAVGAAGGRNRICVVVPCHRVIGSDGSLTGYAWGLWRKEWLLHREGHEGAELLINGAGRKYHEFHH